MRSPSHVVRLLGAALVAALAFSGCGYNEVIDRDEEVKASWSKVQNQYKRRADLIPQVVKVVKGAANFEQETLQKVVEARASVGKMTIDASTIDDPAKLKAFEKAQGELGSALQRLMVVSERYPELKSSASFRDLQAQIEGTENRIAVARRRYIDAIAEYNKVVLHFPSSIGAGMRGKKERPSFTIEQPNLDQAPEIDL